MKKLFKSKDKTTQQAQPAATKTAKKPTVAPHDPASTAGNSGIAKRIKETEQDAKGNDNEGDANVASDGKEHPETKPRAHASAVEAGRLPVSAPRSQDADPEANKGVTITTEGGTPVAHPGSTLR